MYLDTVNNFSENQITHDSMIILLLAINVLKYNLWPRAMARRLYSIYSRKSENSDLLFGY